MRKLRFTPLRAGVPTAILAVLLASAGGFPQTCTADPFSITHWSVDGGGAAFVQAGPYVLGGTVGQPDAGLVSRLNYTLAGGFWAGGAPSVVGVGDPPDPDPGPSPGGTPVVHEARIHAAAPNPLLDRTRLAFDLPDTRDVEISVFGIHGGRVRALALGAWASGRHSVEWDARDAAGQRVSPGLYFVRVRLGTLEKSLKLVVTR